MYIRMKVAISTEENGTVAHHFGRTPFFTFAEIEGGKLIGTTRLDNPGYINHQPGEVPAFVNQNGANWIIAGGMGPMAVQLFQRANVQVVLGITGPIDSVIEQILNGTLKGGKSLCDHAALTPGEHEQYHETIHGDE